MRQFTEHVVDILTILAIIGTLVIVAIMLGRTDRSSNLAADPTAVVVEDWARYAERGQRLGPTEATVTIIEFGDYQCRYCREAEAHLAAIRRQYGTDVALIFRHFPLVVESASYAAARAAECAGEQGAFWPFHHRLFGSRDWQIGDTTETLKQMGVAIGIADEAAFETCVASDTSVPTIAADLKAVAELDIPGTPAFLVNGRLSMGVLDSLTFVNIYEQVQR